jgi:uncharacterized protein (TIGR02145 family)
MKKLLLSAAFMAASFMTFAQVGIGTTTPKGMLDVTSATSGLVLPRVANVGIVVNPNGGALADGTMVYDISNNCVRAYENGAWSDCLNGAAAAPPNIPGNATCATATISATPCTAAELSSGINGGSLGNKYDNGSGGAYSVVEIGGQCWMKENIDVNSAGSPAWSNNSDVGWYGYYDNTYQAAGEGTLLQWSAAMNGSTAERAQGVCPTGWHVPSDCEWMYLENSLGMTTAQQQLTGYRGTEGQDLSNEVTGGTNSSGFTALLAGARNTAGTFISRGTNGYWWSSSESSATNALFRRLNSSQAGVRRGSNSKALGFSVRCLKD